MAYHSGSSADPFGYKKRPEGAKGPLKRNSHSLVLSGGIHDPGRKRRPYSCFVRPVDMEHYTYRGVDRTPAGDAGDDINGPVCFRCALNGRKTIREAKRETHHPLRPSLGRLS